MRLSDLIGKLMKINTAFGDGEVMIGMKNNYGNTDRCEPITSVISSVAPDDEQKQAVLIVTLVRE